MWSEEEEKMRKKCLKTLLDYSCDETFHDADRSFRANESDLIFGSNSFVSFSRGVNDEDKMSTRIQSTPNGNFNKEKSFREIPSYGSLNISDSDFFDTETGKQQILDDQVSHQRLIEQDTGCTGCSSWTPCSRMNASLLPLENGKLRQKQSVSVGEFIGMYSEETSFSNSRNKPRLFLNCDASTPIERRKSMSLSTLMDIYSEGLTDNLCASFDIGRNESLSLSTPTSVKPLMLPTPKFGEKSCYQGEFPFFIGHTTARKNIQRLKNEERKLRHMGETTDCSFNSLDVEKTITMQSSNSGATGSDTTTYLLSNGSLSQSCYEQWTVEPQFVILDAHKGKKVQLINYSSKNLKFKTTCDSRMTNICPLSGTVPSLEQIGLRLLISSYAKKLNENYEGYVKVIIGKNEKKIRVKFFKEEKLKVPPKRKYIIF